MGFERLSEWTADGTQTRLARLRTLFPECVTEGPQGLAVDFDLLRRALTPGPIVEGPRERYRLDWPGKRAARYAANAPTDSTLRPVRERSKDYDHTENLYIEGDNLEALKLLRTAYSGKVKLIYIDPPYNTGHDFIYRDKYVRTVREEMAKAGLLDDEGRQTEDKEPFRKNDETNGRYHSDWLTMMYPRLLLARDLLTDDGVLFVSIDDNEQANLKRLCDEVFGEENFVAELPTIMNLKGNGDQFGFAGTHEYTLVYLRNHAEGTIGEFGIDDEEMQEWLQDGKGYYKQGAGLVSTGVNSPRSSRPRLWFPLFVKEGKLRVPPKDEVLKFYDPTTGVFNDDYLYSYIEREEKAGGGTAILPLVKGREASWRWGYDRIVDNLDEILVVPSGKSYSLYKKQRPALGDLPSKKPKTLFYKPEYSSGNGTREVEALLKAERLFSHPKPLALIKDFVRIGAQSDSLVLDFFSGSATTAHAVMQLNAEDGGTRRFILVQLPEAAEMEEAAKAAGFANICEIGEERIRRAGEAILGAHPEQRGRLDVGFRVLRVDETNERRVEATPEDALANWEAATQEERTKADRSEEDLLFQALLRVTEPLFAAKIERAEVAGVPVWAVEDGFVLACLVGEGRLTAPVAAAVTRWMTARPVTPSYAVFRESGFADDTAKANVESAFRQLGHGTTLWVL